MLVEAEEVDWVGLGPLRVQIEESPKLPVKFEVEVSSIVCGGKSLKMRDGQEGICVECEDICGEADL